MIGRFWDFGISVGVACSVLHQIPQSHNQQYYKANLLCTRTLFWRWIFHTSAALMILLRVWLITVAISFPIRVFIICVFMTIFFKDLWLRDFEILGFPLAWPALYFTKFRNPAIGNIIKRTFFVHGPFSGAEYSKPLRRWIFCWKACVHPWQGFLLFLW